MVHEPSDFAGISRHARYELMPSFDGAVSVITWLPLAQGPISKSQSQCRMQMHRIHILVGCTVFLPQQLFGHTRLRPTTSPISFNQVIILKGSNPLLFTEY